MLDQAFRGCFAQLGGGCEGTFLADRQPLPAIDAEHGCLKVQAIIPRRGQRADRGEAAAAQGWIDRERTITETVTSIRRAGADIVLTYWAAELARS